ncbi:protein kinase family protein [Psychrobacillus vulpis]|uniref:Protein kinase family protein n=1 Tax=Psychrobacillus vulpis TaxID=2325572 RepID=A0A544TSA4_9BACI|nr:protein kinase family protein [Psychrobacillus vulpis]TQR20332.1 protein kinase family protein [Psychrobacillus vulpis]
MGTYETVANTVIIDKKNRLISYDNSLELIGKGRSAFVFKIKSSNKALKIFFSHLKYIAKEEAEIYTIVQGNSYFPTIYESGSNYIVIDYIKGVTLFECLTKGIIITNTHMKEIDYALAIAAKGLNPSDIHLKNIFITSKGDIKIIDVARYRQKKECKQWHNLRKAYYQHYCKPYFIKKVPALFLNLVSFFYKKGLIPFYRL